MPAAFGVQQYKEEAEQGLGLKVESTVLEVQTEMYLFRKLTSHGSIRWGALVFCDFHGTVVVICRPENWMLSPKRGRLVESRKTIGDLPFTANSGFNQFFNSCLVLFNCLIWSLAGKQTRHQSGIRYFATV
jgi:hypothetical protein